MDDNLTNFKFEEHIFRPNLSSRITQINEKIIERDIVALLLRGQRQREKSWLVERQNLWNDLYESFKGLFGEMQNHEGYTMRYNTKKHLVLISGKGEMPILGTYNSNNSLDIQIGLDNAEMQFVDPHRLTELSKNLFLKYYFNTYFSLGGRSHETRDLKSQCILGHEKRDTLIRTYSFTDDIEQTVQVSTLPCEFVYFCGKPGRVFFRGMEDALGAELNDAFFNRERMQIQGAVFSNEQMVYAGQLRFNNTSFPLAIDSDNYKNICNYLKKMEESKKNLPPLI